MRKRQVRSVFTKVVLSGVSVLAGMMTVATATAAPAYSTVQCAKALQAYNEAVKNGTGDKRFRQKLFVNIAENRMGRKRSTEEYLIAKKACSDQVYAKKIAKGLGLAGKAVTSAAPSPGVSGSATTQAIGEAVKATK